MLLSPDTSTYSVWLSKLVNKWGCTKPATQYSSTSILRSCEDVLIVAFGTMVIGKTEKRWPLVLYLPCTRRNGNIRVLSLGWKLFEFHSEALFRIWTGSLFVFFISLGSKEESTTSERDEHLWVLTFLIYLRRILIIRLDCDPALKNHNNPLLPAYLRLAC